MMVYNGKWRYFLLFSVLCSLLSACARLSPRSTIDYPDRAEKPPAVLLILAHPDDESMIGATLLLYKYLNTPIYAIYLTQGEGGKRLQLIDGVPSATRVSPKGLSRIRAKELRRALSQYGVAGYRIFKHPDIALRQPDGVPIRDETQFLNAGTWNLDHVKRDISAYAMQVQPSIVISFARDALAHAHHKVARSVAEDLFKQKKLGSRAQVLMAFKEYGWVVPTPADETSETLVRVSRTQLYPDTAISLGDLNALIARVYHSQWAGYRTYPMADEVFLPVAGDTDYFKQSLSGKDGARYFRPDKPLTQDK